MHPTPLLANFDAADAHWERYGPLVEGGPVIALAGAFDVVDLEYAAIRKSCGLLDLPTRGTLEVRGADALGFLNRMVTQELKNWPAMTARRAFWLSRKGRVEADLRLLNVPDAMGARVLIDVDALVAASSATSLGAFVIADDVTIGDVTQAWHRLALHGPGAASVLAGLSEAVGGLRPVAELALGQVTRAVCAGVEVIVDRCDSAGEIGLELTVPAAGVRQVFERLLSAAHGHGAGAGVGEGGGGSLHTRAALRPIGWHAYNVARIEAGTPLFNVDFGTSSLPAESGVLGERVSFTKGCYLGQEIVARMHALGKPKQVVVGLRIGERPVTGDEGAVQPGAAAGVYLPGGVEAVGVISSATTSPMLGGSAVAFATVKTAHSAAGTALEVQLAPGGPRASAVVQERLAFWSRQG